MPSTAASVNDRLPGFFANLSSRATACSAKLPSAIPNTSSPGWSRSTPGPTASTVPATSRPGTLNFGALKPNASRIG